MKKQGLLTAGGILLLLLFPYILTLFMTGKITEDARTIPESGRKVWMAGEFAAEEMDLEEYLLGVAAAQIPGEYEEEAVKAQVIIARTYLHKILGDREEIEEEQFSCDYWDLSRRKEEWGENFAVFQEKFSRAVAESSGKILTYQGEPAEALFHRASAGATREGGAQFPYLKSVPGGQDVDLEGYVTIREFSGKDLAAAIGGIRGQSLSEMEAVEIQIVSRDAAGYVQTVMAGTEEYSGEEIAAALSLPSPAFSVTKTETGLKFVDKGSGHGYGMSQWGANHLAAEGQDAAAILAYYYQGLQIETR